MKRQKQSGKIVVIAVEINQRRTKGISDESSCWRRRFTDAKFVSTDAGTTA